jgi:hypothetical protein
VTDTKPNAELAYRVLDHIDAEPKSWNQADWYRETDCGTVACFAGWSILLAGGEILNPAMLSRSIKFDGREYVSFTEAACTALGIRSVVVPGSEVYADGDLLVHCDDLFSADNTREDLDRFVKAIFGPRPEVKA